MKNIAMALVFAALLSFSARAADEENKAGEWTVTVNCAHCDWAKETGATACGAAGKVGDKVFMLKGGVVAAEFPKGCATKAGEYVVKGMITADGKTINVTELAKKK